MPLDWDEVKRRYAGGAAVPTVAGGKTLDVTGADDDNVYIRSSLWRDELARKDLELAVALIEEGKITRNPGLFAEDYRYQVADAVQRAGGKEVRATSVAHILKDLGFLD